MNAKTTVETRKKTAQTIIPSRSFMPQRRVALSQYVDDVSASGSSSLHNTLTEPGLGHDFSRIQVHSDAKAVEPRQSCPLASASPRFCPFGGACHTCPPRVQAKLAIGQTGDQYEQEADRMAGQLTRAPVVQRQHRATNRVEPTSVPPIVHDVLNSSGQPLDTATRAFMESRFGADFSRVRVHIDARAAESARTVNALAYTVGRDIVFGAESYTPHTSAGQRLMAHELTHVVQQKGSSAGDLNTAGSPSSGSQAEREAESIALSVVTRSGPTVPIRGTVSRQIQRVTVEECSAKHAAAVIGAAAAVPPAIKRTISAIASPAGKTAFSTYFGSSSPASIGLRLAIISNRLPGASVECENPGEFMYDWFCGGRLAYVRPVPAFFGFGNIHVCQPGFHNLTGTQQMATLVHEGAHRFIDAADEAYYTLNCQETSETRALSDSDRRDNADSYACLVQTLG